MESNDNDNSEKTLSDFEKIMQLNKLGALFLSGDKYDKALNILSKTLEFYIEKKQEVWYNYTVAIKTIRRKSL